MEGKKESGKSADGGEKKGGVKEELQNQPPLRIRRQPPLQRKRIKV